MTDYPLGKKPASPLSKKAIMFDDVFDATLMPQPPTVFGRQDAIPHWYVYGNDEYGDCVWAAKAHMHMLWPILGGYKRNYFWTSNVLSDYAAATGFHADDPGSDQGTDMKLAAEYHRKIGVSDAHGTRHRVAAYVNMTPGNVNQLAAASYVFGAVELGIVMSKENMNQFDRKEPWTVASDEIVGGHCIPIVGRDADGNFLCISWGRIQRIAPSFIEKNMDEGITYLDQQILNNAGLSPGAYDKVTLLKMLAKVSPQRVIKTAEQIAAEEKATQFAMMSPTVPSDEQFAVAFKILRDLLDQSGYGWALSDAKLRPYSDQIAISIVNANH
jgi:hypothetical protein